MEYFERDGARIAYVQRGTGFPVLLFAPGGMRSIASNWKNAPWNPVEELSDAYRVIALDQRNAGRSTAPIAANHGWHTYTADHVALLDHLGLDRCHVIGGCIGGSYALGLIQAAPERVAAAVLQQPIGFDGSNREMFYEMFDGWARELAPAQAHMQDADWRALRSHMYDGDFVFNVERAFVKRCPAPLLVLMGRDVYHPESTSREIASTAPSAELVERWKEPETVAAAVARVRAFLAAHTPGSTAS
jgi:pimeloyl-ACP methyl ester carboxylesterase